MRRAVACLPCTGKQVLQPMTMPATLCSVPAGATEHLTLCQSNTESIPQTFHAPLHCQMYFTVPSMPAPEGTSGARAWLYLHI